MRTLLRWTCPTCSVPRQSRSPRPLNGLCLHGCWPHCGFCYNYPDSSWEVQLDSARYIHAGTPTFHVTVISFIFLAKYHKQATYIVLMGMFNSWNSRHKKFTPIGLKWASWFVGSCKLNRFGDTQFIVAWKTWRVRPPTRLYHNNIFPEKHLYYYFKSKSSL